MSGNRAPKSGFAAEAQRKVSIYKPIPYNCMYPPPMGFCNLFTACVRACWSALLDGWILLSYPPFSSHAWESHIFKYAPAHTMGALFASVSRSIHAQPRVFWPFYGCLQHCYTNTAQRAIDIERERQRGDEQKGKESVARKQSLKLIIYTRPHMFTFAI